MKKLLNEYCKIIGYTIIGLVFGLSFFLLIINFYHYREVNSKYIKQESDYNVNNNLKEKLNLISKNISNFNINNYNGDKDAYSLVSLQSKLNTCTEKINTEEFYNLLEKKHITIKDVYDMQQFYQISIANECLVKQLYDLANINNSSKIIISDFENITPFIENNINQLIKSTDYIQKVIKDNSCYYFATTSSKINIYDQTKDSYYSILNNYTSAIDFIYDISVLFNSVVGG